MFDDGDDILNWVGVVLAFLLIAGVGITVLAAATASERADNGPTADFQFRQVDDSSVRVVHVGGESIRASNVVVTVNGLQRQVTWDGDTVSKGSSLVVTAREGSVVRVFWDPGEGQRKLLAKYEVG